jgi:hypothetical protein
MRFHELPSEPLVIKACAFTYVAFGVMFGVPLLLGLAVSVTHPGSLRAVGLLVSVLALSWGWIGCFKLVVSNKFISYRTLFTGTRSFALSEIESCDLAIGAESYWDRFKPPIRLVIRPRQSTGKKPISVNLKVLSKSDVLWITRVLCHQAER